MFYEDKIAGQGHGVAFAVRCMYEQITRMCKVRFEDELTKHGVKHVGTDGGREKSLRYKTVGAGMELEAT